MAQLRRNFPPLLILLAGIAIGWTLTGPRPMILKAGGGSDRFGRFAVATGTIGMQFNEQSKLQTSQEAIYFIDWPNLRLLATIPTLRQSLNKAQVIDAFVERDLVTDFKLDLNKNPSPEFVMTSGSLGYYGEGWAPLFVFETNSKQVAVYKIQSQSVGTNQTAKFELMQVKPWGPLPPLPGAKP